MKKYLLIIILFVLSCTSEKEYVNKVYAGNNLWEITYTGSSLYTSNELNKIDSELEKMLRKSLTEDNNQKFVLLYVKNNKGEPSLSAIAKPFNSKK